MTHTSWQKQMLRLRAALSDADSEERVRILRSLPDHVRQRAMVSPYILARDAQLKALTSDADIVLVLAGRGYGKNWIGAHWIISKVHAGHQSLGAIGETAGDVRDYMVDPSNDTGILDFAEQRGLQPQYQISKKRVSFQNSEGKEQRIKLASGDKPDGVRGFSGSIAWIDELAKMRYAQAVWDQVGMTMREGDSQQILITTTPRPIPIIKELVAGASDPDYPFDVELIQGSSLDNKANLGRFMLRKIEKLRGTRLGRQEIDAEILDAHGELWTYDDIGHVDEAPDVFDRIVIGLDPSVSDEEGDEAGIIPVGKRGDKAYVLADLSGQYTTREWAAVTVAAYKGNLSLIRQYLDAPYSEDIQRVLQLAYPYQPADKIHAERNQGGSLVEQQLKTLDKYIAYNSTHTSQSKHVRAEPVHTLYQTGNVVHVGQLSELEQQQTEFTHSGDSPDRVDALVYAVHDLLLQDANNDRTEEAWDKILSLN